MSPHEIRFRNGNGTGGDNTNRLSHVSHFNSNLYQDQNQNRNQNRNQTPGNMALSDVMASLRARLRGDKIKYMPLDGDVEAGSGPRRKEPGDGIRAGQNRRLLKLTMTGLIILVILYVGVVYSRAVSCNGVGCAKQGPSRLWGQYSPYFPVTSEISSHVPHGCRVTFAQVLSRHGARDPTAGKTVVYNETIARIQATTTAYGRGYEFLRDYAYRMGADELTVFGERQMRASGRRAHHRYGALARKRDPFVRASGQRRVVMSAANWTQGFFSSAERSHRDHEGSILVLPEGRGMNNTLSHGLCSVFEDSNEGAEAQKTWAGVFVPPLTAMLNGNLTGADLTDEDTIHLMDMCPFDTVADPDGRLSPFCSLFTTDEWRGYDYYQSLGKYYGYAAGSRMGPTQGVGFVNELVARLTGQPVTDHTSSNTTLDGSPDTFPLDRALYADFSHDNDMATIYAALGLYNSTLSRLPTHVRRAPADADGFSAAWTVPFAARMYVEKMACRAPRGAAAEAATKVSGADDGHPEELVRILVNDRVVPPAGCGADSKGRCKLSAFVESLGFAKSGGLWGACSGEDWGGNSFHD